jgi:hypothetical protein
MLCANNLFEIIVLKLAMVCLKIMLYNCMFKRKTRETFMNITKIISEIRTRDLLNMKQETDHVINNIVLRYLPTS